MHIMLGALLLASQPQVPVLDDQGLRPPSSGELRAAEQRERRRLPVIVQACREAVRSGNLERHVAGFADRNGLSSFGRLALLANCRLYEQGTKDRSAAENHRRDP